MHFLECIYIYAKVMTVISKDHGDTVVKHLASTSEVGGSHPGPYVGKLVIAYEWSAVYSTEP